MPLVAATALDAQSVMTVPASSGVYDKLESISAFFPTRGVFLGERSLSMRQLDVAINRLLITIDSASPGARREWARRELGVVASALRTADGLQHGSNVTTFVALRADLTASNARSERFTSNGLGTIDAVTNPFEPARHGWPVVHGTIPSFSPTVALTKSDWLALAVQPRVAEKLFSDGGAAAEVRLDRAYARMAAHNVAVRVGPDEMHWGQSPRRALFISGNASPLPAITLGTDTAITLPWLFRLAGPTRAMAMLADLGGSQDPEHAKLAGWQVSIEPWSRFELGVAVLAQSGGRGAPPASVIQRVIDLFPVIDALSPQHSDLQISNKLAGGNLRLRFPELSGLDVYYELQIDDFDGRRLRSSLVDDSGHLLGARLPFLVGTGQLAWRAEWHRTSIRLYEHSQFRSGVTYRERIIGDPLGPHATGAYVSGSWQPSSFTTWELALANESRDPSIYHGASLDSRDRGFTFVLDTVKPLVRRNVATASFERAMSAGAVRVTVGYNRAWQSDGLAPARHEWLAELELRSHYLPVF